MTGGAERSRGVLGGALGSPRQSRTSSDLAHLINVEGGDECQEGMDEVPVEQAGQKVEEDRQLRKRISERFLKMGHSVLFLDFCTMGIDNGGYFGGVVRVAAL